MALVNRTHPELGTVILNTETNKFVTGSIGSVAAEFIIFDESFIVRRSDFEYESSWMVDVEESHTSIVADLEADGFGVDFPNE